MNFQSVSIKPKKLKTTWTPELAQDLQAYMNVDVYDELNKEMKTRPSKKFQNKINYEFTKS